MPDKYTPEYCYGCGKIRVCGMLPCKIVRCERCIKQHIKKCDTCSKVLYIDGEGKLQEFLPPREPSKIEVVSR